MTLCVQKTQNETIISSFAQLYPDAISNYEFYIESPIETHFWTKMQKMRKEIGFFAAFHVYSMNSEK